MRAFTLIELLVVMGIVVVVMAILLPALGIARQSAQRVQCLSNLRQMVIAANIYADRFHGSYPIAYYSDNSGGVVTDYAWDLTTISGGTEPTRVVAGLLWEGKGAGAIQQCPSFDGDANWLVDPFTGYNYNTSYIGHGQFETVEAPAKMVAIRRPVEVAIFGDGQWGDGANKFMRAPWPSAGDLGFIGRWGGTQGFRHRGKTNVAFCDGHAESLADRFVENADGAENVAKGTGFLSADNRAYGQ
ncbi:MAG TPA: H-X9-DG-CTERM domain-containing protein [Tepidisphaeraceae bacterium]|jgi:prepilin-type processing-associated H-X9-DG protein/prepilin-type N-terminal cleavage/methylation domain-containing protein|nr:H-X9-DG-CTERM domain-containing protein [Tepidisphaeraceae bacterium]